MQVPSSQGSTSSEPGPRPPIHGVKAPPRLLLARKAGEGPAPGRILREFGKLFATSFFGYKGFGILDFAPNIGTNFLAFVAAKMRIRSFSPPIPRNLRGFVGSCTLHLARLLR